MRQGKSEDSHLSLKPEQGEPRSQKEDTSVISREMLSLAQEVWRFLLGSLYGMLSSRKTLWVVVGEHIPSHAQFKVRSQEGRRMGALSSMLSSGS